MAFRDPTRYGRYEIVGPLATGGMADLMLARVRGPEGFETLAVVKRILPHLARSPEFVRLFLREARLAAQLRHPNIVHVYDAGQERGQYYFVMEYVHGRDLRAVLNASEQWHRPLRFEESLSIISGVCAGLHHAHERIGPDGQPLQIVHRDVTPSNVLVSFDGAVKLADFGIAKATSALPTEGATNTMRGKVGYMSPEQCLGEPLDRRSDVYSLSVVLYELTTGERPHPAAPNDFLTIKQTLETPVRPPSSVRKDYPAELERLVLAGLARDRAERPQSAGELLGKLEEVARKNGWLLSTSTVAKLVTELFGTEVHAWEAAQKSGKPLLQHLTETGTVSVDHAAEAQPEPAPAEPPRQIDWRRLTLATAAALIAAFAIAFAVINGHPKAPPAAPAPTVAAPAPIPAPAPEPPPPEPTHFSIQEPTRVSAPRPARAPAHAHKKEPDKPRSTKSWDPESATLPH
jgi:serine/threonine protein kinase